MKVYMEDLDEDDAIGSGENGDGGILPVLNENEDVKNLSLEPSQHFTKPPARYTEASLVKKLESEGIGRPSTYAPTISTIQLRGYVKKDGKHLIPTDIGEVVTDVLVENFSDIVDYKFTAEMEDGLDEIAEGKKEWVPVIKAFYGPFHANIEDKMKTLKKSDIVNEETDAVCEKCGKSMVIKLGRFGKFLSCTGYPECKNAKPLNGEVVTELGAENGIGKDKFADVKVDEKMEKLQKENEGKVCEKCGKPMKVRKSRYGYFLGCTGYPKCKTIVAIEGEGKGAGDGGAAKAAPVRTGVKCPECGEGELVERRTRRGGKLFWGCSRYPKCKHATWDKPV
jgi:DNA topoisomerase-1